MKPTKGLKIVVHSPEASIAGPVKLIGGRFRDLMQVHKQACQPRFPDLKDIIETAWNWHRKHFAS